MKRAAVSAVAMVLMIGLMSVSGCSSDAANTYSKTIQEMTTYINQMPNRQIANDKIKGLAIALIDDQRTVWAEGFGKADVANEYGQQQIPISRSAPTLRHLPAQ